MRTSFYGLSTKSRQEARISSFSFLIVDFDEKAEVLKGNLKREKLFNWNKVIGSKPFELFTHQVTFIVVLNADCWYILTIDNYEFPQSLRELQ